MTFTDQLDVKSVQPQSFTAKQWHYHYSSNYGSPKKDLTAIEISHVKLSKDNKSVEVVLPLTQDKVVQIDFTGLKDVNGRSVSVDKVYYTLNQLRK